MVYDARTKNVVLFGGLVEPNVVLGDTWSWDGSHWTQLSPAHRPPARYNAAIAYDAGRGLVVLVGGSNGDLSDTWTWDGTDWSEMHPAAYPKPLRKGTIGMDYDAAHDRIVLFGVGQPVDGYSFQTETWTWNGRDWKELSPSRSPSIETITGRAFTMAYYPPTGSLILVAGTTWAFEGSTWKPVPTSGSSPTGERSNMSYDTSTASLVLLNGDRFDGTTTDPRFNGTWTWKGASWTRLSPATSPARISSDARLAPSMTYDAARGVTVVFGGTPPTGDFGGSNIVWTWDGTTWTRVG